MPSPFPGMDPYLENPQVFLNFHHGLISAIQGQLNRELRPKYVALVEDRVYLSNEIESVSTAYIPDVKITETGKGDSPASAQPIGDVVEPIVAVTMDVEEIHDHYLVIREVDRRKIVTVIEVLSPTNKRAGNQGRKEYLRKRRHILRSKTHLVEIDLLRRGRSTFLRRPLPPHHYAIHVSRSNRRPEGKLWPIDMTQRLPTFEIPLRNINEDAQLDLQSAVSEAYDRGAYDLVVDYRKPCRPPVPPELEAWWNSLRAHSLRG